MGATRSGRMLVIARGFPARLALAVVILLLAGCGPAHTSSVFNAAAPLAPDVNVCCLDQMFSATVTPGLAAVISELIAVKGRDGTNAWHADTGNSTNLVRSNGVIYGESQSAYNPQHTAFAVRLADGHILWQVPLPFPIAPNTGNPTIAADDETVLITDHATALYALDAATGATRWHMDGMKTYRLAIENGVAIVLGAGSQDFQVHLVAYQASNGKLLWRGQDVQSDTGFTIGINHTAIYLSPIAQTTSPDSRVLLAYDPHTGQQLWHGEIIGGIVGVTDQTIILSKSSIGGIACLDAATGTLKWKSDTPVEQWQEVYYSPTALYIPLNIPSNTRTTRLIALSLADGKQLWQVDFGSYHAGKVFQEQGVVFVFMVYNGGLFRPNYPNRLYALDATTAKVYWERDMPRYAR